MAIHAIKAPDEPVWVDKVFNSLLEGEGRFGWSYEETADLDKLKDRIDRAGWESLSKGEQDCYQEFLLKIEPGDQVVYINVPKHGKCTLATVTKEYYWHYKDTDFNHRFGVDPLSVRMFDRKHPAVHSDLKRRLVLMGRHWTIQPKHFKFVLVHGPSCLF